MAKVVLPEIHDQEANHAPLTTAPPVLRPFSVPMARRHLLEAFSHRFLHLILPSNPGGHLSNRLSLAIPPATAAMNLGYSAAFRRSFPPGTGTGEPLARLLVIAGDGATAEEMRPYRFILPDTMADYAADVVEVAVDALGCRLFEGSIDVGARLE